MTPARRAARLARFEAARKLYAERLQTFEPAHRSALEAAVGRTLDALPDSRILPPQEWSKWKNERTIAMAYVAPLMRLTGKLDILHAWAAIHGNAIVERPAPAPGVKTRGQAYKGMSDAMADIFTASGVVAERGRLTKKAARRMIDALNRLSAHAAAFAQLLEAELPPEEPSPATQKIAARVRRYLEPAAADVAIARLIGGRR